VGLLFIDHVHVVLFVINRLFIFTKTETVVLRCCLTSMNLHIFTMHFMQKQSNTISYLAKALHVHVLLPVINRVLFLQIHSSLMKCHCNVRENIYKYRNYIVPRNFLQILNIEKLCLFCIC